MSAYQTLLARYTQAANVEGYSIDPDEIKLVVELDDRFVIINRDDNDSYFVGEFWKANYVAGEYKAGDYSGVPLFEGWLGACVEYIRDNV